VYYETGGPEVFRYGGSDVPARRSGGGARVHRESAGVRASRVDSV